MERELADDLARFGVPVSREDCFGCQEHEEGCDEAGAGDITHVQYPRGFDVDWETDLLGSSKPQPRQVSRTDWVFARSSDLELIALVTPAHRLDWEIRLAA